jgi:hypothetical protein
MVGSRRGCDFFMLIVIRAGGDANLFHSVFALAELFQVGFL